MMGVSVIRNVAQQRRWFVPAAYESYLSAMKMKLFLGYRVIDSDRMATLGKAYRLKCR
jgi:hypothetical protein